MSSTDLGSPASEKMYHFISDPGHKENLSGRVRAACVTCRRKKIKCSGQIPCNTCQERGISCEGLIERKRPSKRTEQFPSQVLISSRRSSTNAFASNSMRQDRQNPGSSKHLDFGIADAGSISRPGPKRPTANLMKLDTIGSSDSGYSSGRLSVQEGAAASARQTKEHPYVQATSSSRRTDSGFEQSAETSPESTTAPFDWNFTEQHSRQPHDRTGPASSDFSQDVTSATASRRSSAWPDSNDHSTWWTNDVSNPQTATDLITAADVLEKRAQSLRQLASDHSVETTNVETRRQTIAFPLNSVAQNSDHLDQPLPTASLDDFFPIQQTRNWDSSSLAVNYLSWWDANPAVPGSIDYISDSVQIQQARMSTRQLQHFQPQESPSRLFPHAEWGQGSSHLDIEHTDNILNVSPSQVARSFDTQRQNVDHTDRKQHGNSGRGYDAWPS